MKIINLIKKLVISSSLLFSLISCTSHTDQSVARTQLTVQQIHDLKKSQEHIQEWEEIAPSLKRLVAIESELKSLISELNSIATNESNNIQTDKIQHKITESPEKENNKLSHNATMKPVMANDKVIVSPALPISSPDKIPLNKNGSELYSLQFISLATKESLPPIWEKLQDKHPQLLDNLQPRYQKTTLNGKAYYRLKAGEFHTKNLAAELCKELSAVGENCYITKGIGRKF
jgi:septal ring-binding cell division protein DamX